MKASQGDKSGDEGEATQRTSPHLSAGQGVTLWFTGLSGAGKTTLSNAVADRLRTEGYAVEQLDGDIVRQTLGTPPDFSREGRDLNVRTLSFIAHLLSRNGVIVLVSAISPYRETREEIRSLTDCFLEIYVNAPLSVCESRDVKGLYRRVRQGEIQKFTGIDDPYEPPLTPEVICYTDREEIQESTSKILAALWNVRHI
jgi:adenylylsulfate kinase